MGTTNFNGTINQSEIIVNGSAYKVANTPGNTVQLLATKHGWGSAWWDEVVDLSKDWSSEFFVTAFNGSGTSDGFTFAINGDSKGTSSLGDGGQNLGFFGYDSKGGVKNSYAVLFDMWTTGPVSQLGFSKSDASTIPSANINLSIGLANNSYSVQISYSASRKLLSASVGGKTYEQSVDLQSVVGNSGYLGFTAANGGGTLDTDISNWTAIASKFGNTLIIRGNSIYTIVDGPSWTQAEANSVKLGGHLVTVNDKPEEDLLYNEFGKRLPTYTSSSSPAGALWIGLTDKSIEGSYNWANGEISKWFENEYKGKGGWTQNSDSSQQDYMVLRRNGDNASGYDWDDYWESNATWSGTSVTAGIAETPFIRRGDSAYVIVQGPTWEEAEANAVKLGGHLVTINDAAENEWLFAQYEINEIDVANKNLWTGFYNSSNTNSSNGVWKWSSDEPVTYTNWYIDAGEPNGATQEVMVLGRYGSSGLWNDQTRVLTNIGPRYGIAEIKLAPNNAPTGTPTVSGNFKAGQVITIDRTPIQDADNFTGYTPDFKYSWEVSSNGTTWTPLTTTDATDNNTTYTLTTAEVGKQVRGVVSYLDGYGTQESVKTSPSTAIASTVPGVQMLQLAPPTRSALRSGVSTTSAISYNVSTGEKNLTGIESYLYFDSTQLSVATAGDPFQGGLIGQNLIVDTSNADNDPKTDKILALTYADFGGNFPGTGATLPLTLATLNLVPTTTYSGTVLHLKAANPATGFTATGADLTLAYNAAPVVNSTLPALTTNRGSAFSYTFRSDLFSDSDSALTFSATTATGGVLPSWLSFNPATRTLSGTPNTGGTLNLNLSASDELGTVSTPLSIKIREVQALSSATAPLRYQRNKDLTVPINYSITDGASSTGLSFKVHYNSSLLSFDPTSGVTNKAAADLFQIGAVENDTNDGDNDLTTDRFVSINIASFSGQFPGSLTPTKIADLTFRAADKGIDPITGLRDTAINFTEAEAAQGYGFAGSSAILKPLAFSLDVDGDGKVTALGDGLMVIRKLFGSAFEGDALTSKALSSTATRTTSQIHDYIQGGITSGLLDVDKDGKTTALGDGLMIVRHLFGAAFAGDALTYKALSPSSPYFGDPNASTLVAANIQSLRSVI